MRSIALAVSLCCFAAPPQDPAPGPGATVTDLDGIAVTISATALLAEEAEAGTLYVTRLPYVPLQTGRGEWRIPLAAIARIDVAPPPQPAALLKEGTWVARLGITFTPGAAPAVTTTSGSGAAALDAALGVVAATLPYRAPRGAGAGSQRPVLLEASVRIRELPQPTAVQLPLLSLRLHNGETASGRATGPLTLEGMRGAGRYRVRLAECRTVEFTK